MVKILLIATAVIEVFLFCGLTGYYFVDNHAKKSDLIIKSAIFLLMLAILDGIALLLGNYMFILILLIVHTILAVFGVVMIGVGLWKSPKELTFEFVTLIILSMLYFAGIVIQACAIVKGIG